MPRFLLLLALLSGCAPTLRNGPDGPTDDDDAVSDDDDDDDGDDLEQTWERLGPGLCDVLPDNDGAILPEGAGWATEGLWYELSCTWTGGNASSITMQFDWFDARQGGDFPLTSIDVRDIGGGFVSMDGEFGVLHLLPGNGAVLNGWWVGELRGGDAVGLPVRLDAVVFRDSPMDSVVGR